MTTKPLVSVGVPVYNEGRYLREALDSIIQQDYSNLEIVISDNASTDDTPSICKEYMEQHGNIRLHLLEENSGPTANYVNTLNHSTGKYFMWASGHDKWANNYISSCARELENHPDAAIAFGSTVWIDEKSNIMDKEYGWSDTRGMDITARYFTIIWGNVHPFVGVIRSDYLKSKPLVDIVGLDLLALSHLILMGDFIHARETHWERREFRKNETYSDKLERYKSGGYGLIKTRFEKLFPLARLPMELFKTVLFSKVGLYRKILILSLLPHTFLVRFLSKNMDK